MKKDTPSKIKMVTAWTLALTTFMALAFCVLMSFVRIRSFEVEDATAAAVLTGATAADSGWDIRGHLSTMTPYKYAATGSNSTYAAPAGCTLVSVDLVARHGSRFPTPRTIGTIKSLEAFVRAHNSTLNLPWMRGWVSPFRIEDEGRLSQMGAQEHYDLGRHFRQMFPGIVQDCDATKVRFRSTFVKRKKIYFHQHYANITHKSTQTETTDRAQRVVVREGDRVPR